MKEKIAEVMAKEGFAEKILACEEPEQVQALFAEEGIELSLDEVRAIGTGLAASVAEGDELDEDALDAVAGGSVMEVVGAVVGAFQALYDVNWRDVGRRIKNWFRRW